MPAFRKLLNQWKSELSYQTRLGDKAGEFLAESDFTNFVRIRIMALVALVIFCVLWIWDLRQFSCGKWTQSFGYPIITVSHVFLILFLARVYCFMKKNMPENPGTITKRHHICISE